MNRWTLLLLVLLPLAACGSGDAPALDSELDGPPPPVEEELPIQVLVRTEPEASLDAVLADARSIDAPPKEAKIVRRVLGTSFYIVELPPGTDVEAFLRTLSQDQRVIVSERNRRISAPEGGGATLPVGGEFFDGPAVANQTALLQVGADIARTRATGQGVRVAVIDTGVVASHVALADRIEPGGWDFVDGDDDPTDEANAEDDDHDGLVDEGFGHGTFAASLILAVAPDARILPYRVLDSDCNGLVSSLAEAISRAADEGVDVINLSLGMEHHVHVVGEAINYARMQGILVIASAGNTGTEEVTFPATLAISLSITAVDPADIRADFSSYGPDIDLSVPGIELLGAYPTSPDWAVRWSGTSFSAAVTTGGFALLRERFPLAPPSFLVDQMANTAFDHTGLNPGYEGMLGRGRLDLATATE